MWVLSPVEIAGRSSTVGARDVLTPTGEYSTRRRVPLQVTRQTRAVAMSSVGASADEWRPQEKLGRWMIPGSALGQHRTSSVSLDLRRPGTRHPGVVRSDWNAGSSLRLLLVR